MFDFVGYLKKHYSRWNKYCKVYLNVDIFHEVLNYVFLKHIYKIFFCCLEYQINYSYFGIADYSDILSIMFCILWIMNTGFLWYY